VDIIADSGDPRSCGAGRSHASGGFDVENDRESFSG
jgi:hypothetical protein